MPSGLFVYEVSESGELILESGNAAASSITGLDVEQIIGTRFSDLWPGQQGARLQKAFLKAFHDNQPVYEPEVSYSDDSLYEAVFKVHAFPLPGAVWR
jgi:hypothetical protein